MTLAERYEALASTWSLAASQYLKRAGESSDFNKLEERAGWHRLAKESTYRSVSYQRLAHAERKKEQQ